MSGLINNNNNAITNGCSTLKPKYTTQIVHNFQVHLNSSNSNLSIGHMCVYMINQFIICEFW